MRRVVLLDGERRENAKMLVIVVLKARRVVLLDGERRENARLLVIVVLKLRRGLMSWPSWRGYAVGHRRICCCVVFVP